MIKMLSMMISPSMYFPLISEVESTFGLLEVPCLSCTAWINLLMMMMMIDHDHHHPDLNDDGDGDDGYRSSTSKSPLSLSLIGTLQYS